MSATAQSLVTIATFPTGLSAHSARGVLEEAGIRATVVGDDVVSVLNIGTAVGPVKLLVREDNCPLAEQLLARAEESSEDAPQKNWNCPTCREEVDAGFEVCWCCGSAYNEDETASDTESAQPECANFDSASSCDSTQGLNKISNAEQTVTRAWRASILGLIFLPGLLHLFSMMLLLKVSFADAELTRSGNRRFVSAFAINVTTGLALTAALVVTKACEFYLPKL